MRLTLASRYNQTHKSEGVAEARLDPAVHRKEALMKGVGVVFDIDALGGGYYGSEAWRIFMRHLAPGTIIGTVLREGDTRETLTGNRREFCIGVFGLELDVEAVRKVFASSSARGLVPLSRRFILSPQLESEAFMEAGMIDSGGRFVADEWDRRFHDRCKDCGWGYAPRRITVDLSAELKAELKAMQDKTVSGRSSTG